MSFYEIINRYTKGNATLDETNKALKEAGANFCLKDLADAQRMEKKLREDKEGSVPAKKETPWWASMHTFTGAVDWEDELCQYIPDKDMVFNRPKYHGVEVVKGSIRYIYAENGKCKYQPKSMKDYDNDHGRH